MAKIDTLLKKAKEKIKNQLIVFAPFVVPDKAAADRVSAELDEFCGDRPYSAIIIYGEDELEDSPYVRIDRQPGGDCNGKKKNAET